MRFDEFAGNAETKKLVSAFADSGRFPHALLIEGPVGSGRRTLARLIARAAVCTGEGERPCGACPACLKAQSGNHPDITEAGGEGAARSFHIDTVREIRDGAYILPNEAARRVIILAGAQGMTEQAQNALLKILEEPPAYLLFILTCENRSQLLETIRSRAVCLTVAGVEPDEAVPVLLRLVPSAGEEDARRAAAVFGGRIGQAAAGLSDGSLRRVLELAPRVAEAAVAPDELSLLRLTAPMEKDRDLADGVLGLLALIFRDALARKFGAADDLGSCAEAAALLARRLTKEQLGALLRAADSLRRARLQNMNPTLFLTLLCSRLRSAAGR